MRLLNKYVGILCLTISNSLFGQNIESNPIKGLFIVYCDPRQDKFDGPINTDSVQIDVDIIRGILNKIPANSSSIPEIKKLIPRFLDEKYNWQSATYDLGYGIKSRLHRIYGGYGSFNVDAIYFGDNVLKIRLTIDIHKEIIGKYLLDVIEFPVVCLNGVIAYEKTYPGNVNKYSVDSGQMFLESVDTNYRRREALNYFTDVMTGGPFEIPFYMSFGLGSKTFDNLRFFIVSKDYQALEGILFSPGPTSRLFAASTLLYMQGKFGYRPGKEVDERIKEVLANARPVVSGVIGCLFNKFGFDYYDVVKDFEHYLVTQ